MDEKGDNYSEDTIDLRTLFRLFLKRKWWFIITVILVATLGFLYIFRIPVLYEARYKFSLRDDYVQDEYLQYSDSQDQLISNQNVFIGASDISLILKTDLIFSALEDIPEVDNYKVYVDSSLIKIDLDKDTSVFSLKVKDRDKKLAKDIGFKLIESLGEQIKNHDIEIFNNTLEMIKKDIGVLEEENNYFEEKISEISREINSLYNKMDNAATEQLEYEIMEKKGEMLLYRERVIDNEDEIRKSSILYQELIDEKEKVDNRVELLTEEPSINIENNRAINSIIVILLSILTGLVVVIAVNYIYKLRRSRN
jgi:polysaccharide biosynthesis transport protein